MAKKDSIEELIERWWAANSPALTVAPDTHAWNIAYAAKERLKRVIRSDPHQR